MPGSGKSPATVSRLRFRVRGAAQKQCRRRLARPMRPPPFRVSRACARDIHPDRQPSETVPRPYRDAVSVVSVMGNRMVAKWLRRSFANGFGMVSAVSVAAPRAWFRGGFGGGVGRNREQIIGLTMSAPHCRPPTRRRSALFGTSKNRERLRCCGSLVCRWVEQSAAHAFRNPGRVRGRPACVPGRWGR